MARPIGRPTKYDPSYIGRVDDYLTTAGADKKHLPKIESFAIFLDVNKTTLYEWAKHNEDFSNALTKIMERQAECLIDGGLYKGANPLVTKLLLMNNHGMREKNELSSDPENPLVPGIAGVLGKTYGETDTDSTETT